MIDPLIWLRRRSSQWLPVTSSLLLLGSCGDSAAPGPDTQQSLFRRELCASCHGHKREGSWMGPPLTGLAEHWQAADLAEFIRDPVPFTDDDPRLNELSRKFRTPMAPHKVMGLADRLRLAEWLLETP
ncbi:MAG: cytochrome c553 [Candidatus Paceibacteria bacterium]|jgi:cytochrome c553